MAELLHEDFASGAIRLAHDVQAARQVLTDVALQVIDMVRGGVVVMDGMYWGELIVKTDLCRQQFCMDGLGEEVHADAVDTWCNDPPLGVVATRAQLCSLEDILAKT